MCSAGECANRLYRDVHKAAVWMMGNNGCDYSFKLSPVDVMILSLGA